MEFDIRFLAAVFNLVLRIPFPVAQYLDLIRFCMFRPPWRMKQCTLGQKHRPNLNGPELSVLI